MVDPLAVSGVGSEDFQASKAIYRRIEVRMWGDERFCHLTPILPSGQGLWIYLLTGPHTRQIPGIFRSGRAAMAEELGWELDDFDKVFAGIFQQGMAKADWVARVVWVPNALKCNPPQSPNVVKSWAKEWELIPECELKREAMESLRINVHAIGKAFGMAFDMAFGVTLKASRKSRGKALANQEQNQEQKQEGDRDVVVEIFDYWKRTMGSPRSKLDDTRRKSIKAALAMGYSPGDLCRAIRGCSLTPHNMGQNERGQRYDGIVLILRNADQIDRFIANDANPPRVNLKLDLAAISAANAAAFLGAVDDPNVIDMEPTP